MKAYGYSIIEVLVACTLVAIIGVSLLTSTSSAIDVKSRVEGASSRYISILQALNRMTRELSMAYISGHKNINLNRIETGFKGGAKEITFNAFGNFIRTKNAKQSDQREISYFIANDKITEKPALMRRVKTQLDDQFGEGGIIQVLCRDVISIEFDYFDSSEERYRPYWNTGEAMESFNSNANLQSSNKSTTTAFLPSRVKITLEAMDEKSQPKKFITEAEIILTKPIQISY